MLKQPLEKVAHDDVNSQVAKITQQKAEEKRWWTAQRQWTFSAGLLQPAALGAHWLILFLDSGTSDLAPPKYQSALALVLVQWVGDYS
ncbi:hypothetical protein ANCCAN_24936 [Ancylostoma caninum]|uniref:Uncharacterized protein n=1 Tax=Ancylostoma caninum TaxID=29170 RepID=A0A368FCG7_ANCCA|nr:hypothetical protein ANCCAN_24936 [Ancylostoma caninum]